MSYSVIQDFFFLLLASLIGVLAGWFLKNHLKKKQYLEEYLALEQEREKLNKRMSKAEENMDRRYYLMTSENQKVHDQLSKSNSDNIILSKKIQSLSEQLNERKTTCTELQEELSTWQNKLSSALKEVNVLQTINHQLSKQQPPNKTTYCEEKNSPTNEVITRAGNTENNDILESLRHELTALHKENENLKTRVAEYNQKKLDITNITSQLNRATSERERLLSNQSQALKKDVKIDELLLALTNAQTQLSEKETELASYKDSLINEEKKWVAEVESSTAKLSNCEQITTELQNQYAESINTIAKLEAEITRIAEAHRQLQTQLTHNEIEHASLKKDHNKQKPHIEQLSSQVRKLTTKTEDE